MADGMRVILALLAGYLLGSLNAAVIVGRAYGKDIKQLGSKSAGLTNALRVLGKPAAALVLTGDVSKAVVACLIGVGLGVHAQSGGQAESLSLLAAGAGAVIGHNWPLYFGFKGGKGALTAAAVMLMVHWLPALICLGIFVALVALTRYVSLGTILATVAFAVMSFVPAFGGSIYFQAFTCVMAGIIVFKHRENIARLLSGTENRLTF